jgi:hypothetical protein
MGQVRADAASLRDCLPEIMDAVGRLLRRVRDGELALPPDGRADGTAVPQGGEPAVGVRAGWLWRSLCLPVSTACGRASR